MGRELVLVERWPSDRLACSGSGSPRHICWIAKHNSGIGAYVLGSIISGGVTSATGYYNPDMILGTVLLVAGAAILTTLKPTTSISHLVGYELIYGFGAGFGFGQPTYVVQTILPECDVPIGVTFITLLQNLSAAIFVAVAQTVFQNSLRKNLEATLVGGSISGFLQTGASEILGSIPQKDRPRVLEAFSGALVHTFFICVAVACITVFGTVGTRWHSMKTAKQKSVMVSNGECPEDAPQAVESQGDTARPEIVNVI